MFSFVGLIVWFMVSCGLVFGVGGLMCLWWFRCCEAVVVGGLGCWVWCLLPFWAWVGDLVVFCCGYSSLSLGGFSLVVVGFIVAFWLAAFWCMFADLVFGSGGWFVWWFAVVAGFGFCG